MIKTVLVAGAGVVGMSTAIWLQRYGYRVTLVDQAGPASGTSYGNAGIQKAADETGAACSAKSTELANWYFEQLAANGMSVEDAGDEFLVELQAIGAKMTAQWLQSVGDDGQAIIDAYKAN